MTVSLGIILILWIFWETQFKICHWKNKNDTVSPIECCTISILTVCYFIFLLFKLCQFFMCGLGWQSSWHGYLSSSFQIFSFFTYIKWKMSWIHETRIMTLIIIINPVLWPVSSSCISPSREPLCQLQQCTVS